MPASPKGPLPPVVTASPGDAKHRLSSWKEIASYFHRDIRTVQLWERKEGLPVHRHEHSARASVYAYPSELDEWFKERARKRDPEAPAMPSGNVAEAALSTPLPASSIRLTWKLLPLGMLLAVLAAAGWFAWRTAQAPALPSNGTLAVLPFLNLTGDATQDYLSDGLTDELTTMFASELRLRVVARTSAFAFKGKPDDVRSIGKRLNAAMVLEGSVEAHGDQLRVNAQLVRTSDGYHVWSHLYDGGRGSTSAVEQLIVRDVGGVLKLPPLPNATAAIEGPNEEAHALYLRGQYWWNRRSPADEWKAISYFNQAIDHEPLYARAYLGMALAYVVLGVNDQAPPAEVLPKAREAAEKALQIDPRLSEAEAVLAHIHASYDWNYPVAESEFRQAIIANPSFVPARHWYGLMLMYQRRFDEAEREIRHAQQLDPLSPIYPALLSRLYLYAGKYDSAVQLCQEASRGNPTFPLPHYALGQVYLYHGQYPEALEEFQKYYVLSEHDPDVLTYFALVYAGMGNRAKALEMLKKVQDSRSGYTSPYNDALVFAALGEKDKAYAGLDKAIGERSPAVIQLPVDPGFRVIRSETRFQQMLRRTGHVS